MVRLERDGGLAVATFDSPPLNLFDRAMFEGLKEADTLLSEVKAAGIDVATRRALEAGLDVVYVDNIPMGTENDDPSAMAVAAAEMAIRRFDG